MATEDPKMRMSSMNRDQKLRMKLLYTQRVPTIIKNINDIKAIQQ